MAAMDDAHDGNTAFVTQATSPSLTNLQGARALWVPQNSKGDGPHLGSVPHFSVHRRGHFGVQMTKSFMKIAPSASPINW